MDGTYITAAQAGTLDGLFRQRVLKTPEQEAFTYFDTKNNQWQTLSWRDMHALVCRWQTGLARLKLRPGDRIAILLRNGPDWVAIEQAALSLGLVVVPLYMDDRPDNVHYVLNDAGVKWLALPNLQCWEKFHRDLKPLADLSHVVLVDEAHAPASPWEDTQLHAGAHWLPTQTESVQPYHHTSQQLATIVYTSGTTGRPKGVMLSHQNILFVAEQSGLVLQLQSRWRLLSFLPLSHTFERTAGYYIPMMFGLSITYARSVQLLADDIVLHRPHVLIAVPRIFERFHERIQDHLQKSSLVARTIFNLAVHVGWQRFLAQQGRGQQSVLFWLWPLLKKKVADPIINRFGGELVMAVSGGAPLPPAIARLFIGLGLTVLQGYGMTESAPVIAANRPHQNDPASVGPPLDGVEVRIGDNDELQVKSPGVMLGYWNNHKATHDTITSDGWLRTGDKVRIENNRIYITGRIKDILVMSNGEKIPPVDMEEAIKLDPLFSQALIIGESRSFLCALVVLNAEHWFKLAKELGVNPQDPHMLKHAACCTALLERISKALHGFPGYAKVRRVTALLDPWTIENGLLTPTLKTKRQQVMQHHTDIIEAMYS